MSLGKLFHINGAPYKIQLLHDFFDISKNTLFDLEARVVIVRPDIWLNNEKESSLLECIKLKYWHATAIVIRLWKEAMP